MTNRQLLGEGRCGAERRIAPPWTEPRDFRASRALPFSSGGSTILPFGCARSIHV